MGRGSGTVNKVAAFYSQGRSLAEARTLAGLTKTGTDRQKDALKGQLAQAQAKKDAKRAKTITANTNRTGSGSIQAKATALSKVNPGQREALFRQAGMSNSEAFKVGKWVTGGISGSASKVKRETEEAQKIFSRYADRFNIG